LPKSGTKRRRGRTSRVILALALTVFIPLAHSAKFTAEAVKAAYLYRFASYIEWPSEVSVDGPLVIAVTGADDVAAELEHMLDTNKVNASKAIVRRVSKVQDLAGVHILYVGPNASSRSRALRQAALEKPILVVTDDPRGLDGGGIINFIEVDRNVRFEISLTAADRSHLKINSALLSVAARVERRPQAWERCLEARCGTRLASLTPGMFQ